MGIFHPVFLLLLLGTSIVSGSLIMVNSADDLINVFAGGTTDYVDDDIEVLADLDFSLSTVQLTDPLGTSSIHGCIRYQGVLKGNNHVIKELKMDKRGNQTHPSAGLFCELRNAKVENLVIEGSCFFAGNMTGALGVRVTGSLTVENVINQANAVAHEWSGDSLDGWNTSHPETPCCRFYIA